jgi:hypothetical protein
LKGKVYQRHKIINKHQILCKRIDVLLLIFSDIIPMWEISETVE